MKSENGQGITEYLLLALVIVAVILIFREKSCQHEWHPIMIAGPKATSNSNGSAKSH